MILARYLGPMWETACNLHLNNWPAALLAGIPLLVTLTLLVYAQRRLPRDSGTLLFELFLFGILWWQAFDVMVRLSATAETAEFWRGMLRFGQIFAIPVGLHFSLAYAEFDRIASNRYFLGPLYAQALALFGFYQNGQIHETLVYHPGWGWLADSSKLSLPATVLVNISALLALTTTLVFIWNAWRVRRTPLKAQAAMLMAVGHAVPSIVGIGTEVLLPNFGMHQWPITGSTATFFGVCAAIALTKYNMFSVSTPAAAQAVLNSITDPLMIARADGRLLYANQQARLSFDIQQVDHEDFHLGRLFLDGERARLFFEGPWRQTVAGQRFTALDVEFRQENTLAPFLVSLAPIPLTRQGDLGVAVVAHNVQRLKAVEADLVKARDDAQEANRSKSLFLANMSHELRTPLNAIIGYAELLEEDVTEPASKQDLGRIRNSGRYLLSLINDVLDLAKVESGKLEVQPSNFSVQELIQELKPSIVQLVQRRNNHYELHMPDGLRPLYADRIRTRQVMLNLLSNAAKFTEHGQVQLTIEQDAQQTQLHINDTGIGMDQDQLDRLFGSFTQVHNTHHGNYGGTGLGLALSRKLCQLMGGNITVTSQPGLGSTFTVTLPTG